jgi:enediyne biosynthesis protein E7
MWRAPEADDDAGPDSNRRDPLHLLVAAAEQKGDCFVYLAGQPQSFLVNRPEYVRHVLVDRTDVYSKDTPANAGFAAHVAEGLLTSEGDAWRAQRSLMRPFFTQRNVPAFAEVVSDVVGQMVSNWERVAGEGADINLSAEVSQLLFRITAIALFHVDPARWGSRPTDLLGAALPYVGRPRTHPTIRVARSAIRELAEAIVAERSDGAAVDDLLTRLVSSGGADAAPEAVRDHVVTLALAGYTTTASVVAWACYLLAKRPDVADEVRGEINAVTHGRPLTIGDLTALPYLTAVIKETMRLYPPAWILGRRALSRDRIGDTDIPANSIVAISPYVLHRHPGYWSKPETFEPRRFMSKNSEETRKPYSYIPFGAGPRTCIGANFALAEAPLIIGLLSQRFRMELASDASVQPHGIFVLRPRRPIRMFLKPVDASQPTARS